MYPAPQVRRIGATSGRRGFSLVLSLTIMAMLLILCIGAAALLSVELRVAQASAAMARARLSAMVGARVALGEIQRLLGPDQRVSATADILTVSSPSAVTVGGDGEMSPKPTESAYYSGPNGTVVHPRWVGVWNSGRMTNGTPVDDGGGPAENESGKVIRRANNGALYDSRFTSTDSANTWQGTGPTAGRLNSNPDGRLMSWLVSGNEALPAGSTLLNPITTTVNASQDVVLLGTGTLGSNFNPEDTSGDKLGARARHVTFTDTAGNTAGGYAFWVSDEGVKARLNGVDRFGTAQPSPGSPLSPGYFRLLTTQRDRFSIVRGLDNTESLAPVENLTSDQIAKIDSFDDIALIVGASISADTLRSNYFNDITFVSRGVLSDTVNGGLKKDMTAYMKGMGTGAGDFTGVNDSDPLLNTANLKGLYPNYGYIKNWISTAPSYTATSADSLLPKLSSDSVFAMPYNSPDYSNQPTPARTPLITQAELYYTVAKYGTGNTAQCGFATVPVVTVWNPYPVALSLNGYNVHLVYCAELIVKITSNNNASGTNWTDQGFTYGSPLYNQSPMMRYALPNVTLPPGRSMTFSAPAGVTPLSQPVYASPFTTAGVQGTLATYGPTNGFFFYPVSGQVSTDAASDPSATWHQDSSQGAMYFDARYTGPKQQLFLTQGNTTVQHAVFDSYATDPGSSPTYTYYHWIFANNNDIPIPTIPTFTPFQMSGGTYNYYNIGWRLLAVDDPGFTSPLRNANFNIFVQNNFRASKFTRYPYDAQSASRSSNVALGGIFNFDTTPAYFNAIRTSPLFLDANTAPVSLAPADVPRKEWGLWSLAMLQHCPMSMMQWMPAFVVGDSYASPVVDTVASALGKDVEAAAWQSGILSGGAGGVEGLPEYYSNYLAAKAKGGDTPLYFVDLSYELNKVLYDSWFVSGAGMGASGVDSGVAFNRGQVWAPTKDNFANSRFTSTGKVVDCPSPLYAAAAGLMLDGAFNVNSTSQAAWEALFSSARGIAVPAVSGTGTTANATPFPHLAKPLTGSAATASTGYSDRAAWAGFRTVTDDEIRVLAGYMVQTVKERGPFLGLSDFINRRLRANLKNTPDSYWEFTGALQAAIDRTTRKNGMINAGLESPAAPAAVQISRVADVIGAPTGSPANNGIPAPGGRQRAIAGFAANRVVSKAVGAPGYLTQADMLQHIGTALTARSDTFVIRSVGDDAATGAQAAVEITVQRTPEAVIPYQQAQNGACVPTYSKTTGQQLFGRRFAITGTRWLAINDL